MKRDPDAAVRTRLPAPDFQDLRDAASEAVASAARGQLQDARRRLALQQIELDDQQRAVQEAQRRIADLRRFTQIVGHDLRGPLIGIVGVAELACRAVESDRPDQALALLDAIVRQSRTSLDFLDSLLAATRAERPCAQRERVDLGALVQQSIDRVLMAQDGGRSVCWCIDELPDADLDPVLMRQVLDNLIGNAVKFSCDREEPRIDIHCERGDDELTLHIEDNGDGFDAAHANLFAPFARGAQAGREGHGLGLTIARAAVEAHGGRIWCHSAPGQGATFSFMVRLCDATPGEATALRTHDEPPAGT